MKNLDILDAIRYSVVDMGSRKKVTKPGLVTNNKLAHSAVTLAKILPQVIGPYGLHEEYAKNKIWLTEEGKEIPYKKLEDDHLDNIIQLLENTKTNRKSHYKGIIQEKLRRTTKAGRILYGKGK